MTSPVRRGFRLRQAIPAAFLALGAGPAGAQRTTYTNFNSWYIFAADIGLTDRWSAALDIQERRSGPIRQPQAFFFRPSASYAVTPGVRLGFGMARSESYPYGKIPNAYQTPEWRIFEQLQLAHNIDRLAITHRYRIEQRWQGRRGTDTSDHRIATWLQLGRARYQLKALLPLHGQSVGVGTAYFTASDEIAIGFGRNISNNVFDQNRAAISAGVRYARAWRAEIGFLEQTLLKANGKDLEQNPTLTFGLYYSRGGKQKE